MRPSTAAEVMEFYVRKAEEVSEFFSERQLTQPQLHLFLLYDLLATGSFEAFVSSHNFAQPIHLASAEAAKMEYEGEPLTAFECDAGNLYGAFLRAHFATEKQSYKPSF